MIRAASFQLVCSIGQRETIPQSTSQWVDGKYDRKLTEAGTIPQARGCILEFRLAGTRT